MEPRVLFIVASDPRKSSRPAEALRIAVGVGVWQKAEISIYLRDNAIRALGEATDDLMDEENFRQYVPVLADSVRAVYAQKNAPALRDLGTLVVPFTEISDSELAALAASQTYTLRF